METVLMIQQQNAIGTLSTEFVSEVDFNCEEEDEIIPITGVLWRIFWCLN